MEHSRIVKRSKKVKTVKSKLEKFEDTLNKSLDIVEHNKHISSEETQLLELSFETMLNFLTKKSEEL